jgi:hypothetical protein
MGGTTGATERQRAAVHLPNGPHIPEYCLISL